MGTFKVCGNYCGPGWCSGQYASECDATSGKACLRKTCTESGPTDGSPADSCCKAHDKDTKWCTNTVDVATSVIWAGMKLNTADCCGSSCSALELELRANRSTVV